MEDLVHGEAIPEDEVHGARDVAVLEVVPALVIVQRVLRPDKVATEEDGGIPGDAQRHRLLVIRPYGWQQRSVLPLSTRTRHQTCIGLA